MTNQRIPSRFRGNVQAYFARHAQTLVGSLGRMVNQPFATLMTMGVVAVALALPLFLNLFLNWWCWAPTNFCRSVTSPPCGITAVCLRWDTSLEILSNAFGPLTIRSHFGELG